MLDDDGEFVRKPARVGLPVRRPPGVPTPCHKCPKVPERLRGKGASRADAVELSPRNAQAWAHYRECRAVGSFPDDPLVRRHAAILRAAEEACERRPLEQLAAVLVGLGVKMTG